MKRRLAKLTARAALLAVTAGALPARAQAPEPSRPAARDQVADAQQRAQAIALYKQAVEQMKAHAWATACPKLEAAIRLDPSGVGGKLKLGECYEGAGKRASAWAAYEQAEVAAGQARQPGRQKKARDRLVALEPTLAQLTVTVPAAVADLPGLEIRRDGVPVAPAAFGTPLPVDQGTHVIAATAPGRLPWETRVEARDSAAAEVVVPTLAEPPPPPPPPVVTPPEPPPPRVTPPEPPPPGSFWSTPRKAGAIAGAAGLVVFGVGTAYGILTIVRRDQSNDGHCDGNLCDPTGIQLRQRGIGFAGVSTALSITGGLVAAGGVVLFVLAPRAPAATTPPALPPTSVSLGPRGLSLSATW